MNILTNIYTYTYNTLLLLEDESLKQEFNETIISKLDFLKIESEKRKYTNKLQKDIISVLNKFINNNTFSRKEESYLKDLRNYYMQVKNALLNNRHNNPVEFLTQTDEVDFKQELTQISEEAGIIHGKLKSVRTGEIIETVRNRKSDKLNFFDKNYEFSYKIKNK